MFDSVKKAAWDWACEEMEAKMYSAVGCLALTVCVSIASPAVADCLASDSLDKGVSFTRANGMGGTVQRDGESIRIEYEATAAEGNRDSRIGQFGIYETQTDSEATNPDPDVIDGWGRTLTVTRFARTLVMPVPYESFTTSWVTRSGNCSAASCDPNWEALKTRERGTATYWFLAQTDVQLSGCTYAVIPVEAAFLSEHRHYTRRWLFYPELGFGLETRVTNNTSGATRTFGLTSMNPAG
jgi:hypothetical protein